jgi:multidrug efflux pump subunit AcrB
MRKVTEFFVRYPLWVTVLMFSVVGFGLISLGQLRYSFFPEIPPDTVIVQVAYPGASPEEVSEGVILKIEEALDGLDGVDRVTSVSRENFGSVNVESMRDADMDRLVTDVKNAIDRINSFPEGSEKPIIFEQKFRIRALSVVLFGQADLYDLKYIAEDFRDDLLATEEISQVDIEGLPDLEISVEVAEADMRRYRLTFAEVAEAVGQANIDLSGGKVETADEEMLIRASNREYFAEELLDVPVRGSQAGTVVYLRRVADVGEQWEDDSQKRFYNGRPALVLNIDQTEGEDILAIRERVGEMIDDFNSGHTTIEASVLDDRTVPLVQRVNLLTKNGLIGLILVIISLGFFLNLRLSWWVAISIPFSFAGMFIMAGFAGLTINVISLFGMIIVVGILVDDAIVVGENIYAHFERGKPPLKAAVDGTAEVIAPVATSVLTTVIAFLPFFFLDALLGKIIWQMALVVVASLLFSLLEAFLILPSHLARSKGLRPHRQDPLLRKKIERLINHLTHNIYGPALKFVMRYKWVTLVTPIALVMVTVGLVGGGLIGATFFPFIDGDTVPVNVSLVAGRQEADTESVLEKIEKKAWELAEELKSERLDGEDVILAIQRDLGSNDLGETGSHTGRLVIQLMDGEERDMESFVIANRLRERVGPVPEAKSITFGRLGHFGKPVAVSLLGKNEEDLLSARDLLVAELENFSTLKDVTDTDREGRREIRIRLKPRAYALGLTLRDVAGQVRQGFFGQEVQRLQRGRDEIRVWVRYKDEDRSAIGFLDDMRIRVPGQAAYPFSELAEYEIERGVTAINHLDRLREIRVEANLVDVGSDLPPILAEIREEVIPGIMAQVQGVTASFEGQQRNQAKLVKSMQKAFPIALLGMIILVILVFRSYAQAVIIFSLIPIGILGGIWGHGIQGLQLNMLSVYGFIALSGIIINDSIVFVDRINRNLKEGQSVQDAVYNAGISRLRPILLTTLTTALGLAPLILETSRQAQFLIPMAVAVAYGLLFGTFILLLILPASFLVLNSIRVRFARIGNTGRVSPETVEPAVKELENPLTHT